ncbi:hypothetical protein H8S90_20300 [Olivibacter sp. SDN3]|uniref:AEC family transporter n=1 Tax=Olivibacter sp. SDN3 TaxID=2764720 RepID=UPI001650F677|nr:AEC family transporter [Olivibacter sp. SDN3]QNL49067.1 hypothetical protein H8S90_20300 [Olivibacter sp. SDN3]
MDVIKQLSTHVLPLYGFIILGYAVNRWLGLKSKWIAKILLFGLIPLLIMDNLLKAELKELFVAIGIIFVFACLMNIPAYFTHRYMAKDFNVNLLQSSFSYYNIGWFGIPITLALFGDEQLPLIISAYVGNALYGDTIGYYLFSRTKKIPIKHAIYNVFKIPAIYACIIALTLNSFSFELPSSFEPVTKGIGWTVSSLGMLIVGIMLGGMAFNSVSLKSFGKLLIMRYLSGALALLLLIGLEHWIIQILDNQQQKLLLLIATFPVAANLIVFAAFLETEKESSALLVALSTLFSLFLTPVCCYILFK